MNHADLAAARSHPAAVAALVAAAIAVTACALVAIAYMLGWVPREARVAAAPASVATPNPQASARAHGVDLIAGETLVSPPDLPTAAPVDSPTATAPLPQKPATASQPTTPKYARSLPVESPALQTPARKALSPIYTQPAPPASSSSYAQVLPSRAAPSKPDYNRAEPPYTSYERSSRNLCVNCGVIASIGSSGGDWEVRVRFEDGSSETLRYPDRPPFRIGERIHLEDGRLVAE